jgi:hypothetical protein
VRGRCSRTSQDSHPRASRPNRQAGCPGLGPRAVRPPTRCGYPNRGARESSRVGPRDKRFAAHADGLDRIRGDRFGDAVNRSRAS